MVRGVSTRGPLFGSGMDLVCLGAHEVGGVSAMWCGQVVTESGQYTGQIGRG